MLLRFSGPRSCTGKGWPRRLPLRRGRRSNFPGLRWTSVPKIIRLAVECVVIEYVARLASLPCPGFDRDGARLFRIGDIPVQAFVIHIISDLLVRGVLYAGFPRLDGRCEIEFSGMVASASLAVSWPGPETLLMVKRYRWLRRISEVNESFDPPSSPEKSIR